MRPLDRAPRRLQRGGGLGRALPATGAATLVGCLAIAALPPLNGFSGEWMLFRTLIGAGGEGGSDAVRLTALLAVGALALAGGLAVACFVRLFGIAFLGVGRTPEAAAAREPAPVMAAVLSVLAAGCLVTGIAAAWIVSWLQSVPDAVLGGPAAQRDLAALHEAGVFAHLRNRHPGATQSIDQCEPACVTFAVQASTTGVAHYAGDQPLALIPANRVHATTATGGKLADPESLGAG